MAYFVSGRENSNLGRLVALLLLSTCLMASSGGGININLKSRHLSDLVRSDNCNTTTTSATVEKTKGEIVAVDLSGRFDTHVCSPISSREDGLDPLFRYGRSARVPSVYLGGFYDLNKGLLNAPQRILSELVWKMRIRSGNTGERIYPVSIHLHAEKGLLRQNDYTAMLTLGGRKGEPSMKVRLDTLRPKVSLNLCAYLHARLSLISKSTLLIGRSIRASHLYSRVPTKWDVENSDDWIPDMRLTGNGFFVSSSNIGLRQRPAPVGLRVRVRKRLSWGDLLNAEDNSIAPLLSVELCGCNVVGDIYNSLTIESDLSHDFLRNIRATLSLEKVMGSV